VAPHRANSKQEPGTRADSEEKSPNGRRKSEPALQVRASEKASAGSFGALPDLYGDAWRAIIRPPRDLYEDEALGPKEFSMRDRTYQRHEVELRNPRGQRLVGSHFEPVAAHRRSRELPCVVYLHGNCSSRVEALATLPVLLPLGVTVFCFDFAGSGRSEGEYVSLGYHERDDLATVVDYLRGKGTVSSIGVWGRSMGAVTALLHSHRDPTLAGIVLDSPFASLPQLALELVDKHVALPLPRWLVSGVLGLIRSSVQQRAEFDLYDVDPLKVVSTAFIPALFTAASRDTFILPSHAKQLYDAYAGDKNMVLVDGDHNSSRPRFLMDSIAIFFLQTLQVDVSEVADSPTPPAPRSAPRTRRVTRGSPQQERSERATRDDAGAERAAALRRTPEKAPDDRAKAEDGRSARERTAQKPILIEC